MIVLTCLRHCSLGGADIWVYSQACRTQDILRVFDILMYGSIFMVEEIKQETTVIVEHRLTAKIERKYNQTE